MIRGIVTNFGICVIMTECMDSDGAYIRVNPFGVSFALITVSDLLLIDHKGNIVGGGKRHLL